MLYQREQQSAGAEVNGQRAADKIVNNFSRDTGVKATLGAVRDDWRGAERESDGGPKLKV